MAKSTQEERRQRKKRQDIDDIPDDEKRRLIRDSGLLEKVERIDDGDLSEDLYYGWTFQAFLYTIPLCSVYCVMDILVHRQYSEEIEFLPFFIRIVKLSPGKIMEESKNDKKVLFAVG
jgi:hypothetical protein